MEMEAKNEWLEKIEDLLAFEEKARSLGQHRLEVALAALKELPASGEDRLKIRKMLGRLESDASARLEGLKDLRRRCRQKGD